MFEHLRLALVGFAAFAALHFYGDLPVVASLLIGGAFAIVAISLYLLAEKVEFKPYQLTIGINYERLWEDLKLVPVEGQKFENFTFTALTAGIFARSDECGYSSKLDLYKPIPCGAVTWKALPGDDGNGPRFFFRPVLEGYRFGVTVQQEWWNEHKLHLAPALRDLPLTYDNAIILGVLPYGYIPEHIRRWNEPVSFWYAFDRKQRRWKQRLQERGWTYDDDNPYYLHHRYLVIRYSDL